MYDDILLIKRDNKNIIDMNPVSLQKQFHNIQEF